MKMHTREHNYFIILREHSSDELEWQFVIDAQFPLAFQLILIIHITFHICPSKRAQSCTQSLNTCMRVHSSHHLYRNMFVKGRTFSEDWMLMVYD